MVSVSAGAFCCCNADLRETASIFHGAACQPSDTLRAMKAALLQRDQVSTGRTTSTADLHRESLTTRATENSTQHERDSKHTSHEVQIKCVTQNQTRIPAHACISDSCILPSGENSHCTKFMSTDSWHLYQDPFTFNNDMHIFTFASQRQIPKPA